MNKVLAFPPAFRVLLFVIASTAAATAFVVLSHSSGAQEVAVRISELNCDTNPETLTVVNEGTTEVSMTGWNLQSDPTTQESLALASLGVLSPGETLMVEAGPSAGGAFVWSEQFVFRDGDPTDFAQLASDAGEVLIKVNCPAAQPTAAQTAAPVQTTAPAPTPTVLAAAAAPSGGGPPGAGASGLAPLMMLFGSGLLSAGLATFALPLLRRLPGSDEPNPEAPAAIMEVPELATPEMESSETETRWRAASAPPAPLTRSVVGGDAVVNKSSQGQDSLLMYLAVVVVILAVVAMLAYLLQGGENKRE